MSLKHGATIKMRIEEIIKSLPNGFHDAELKSINLDYLEKKAVLFLDIWTGDLTSHDTGLRETYKAGILEIEKFLFFSIEAPDQRYEFPANGSVTIDLWPLDLLKDKLKGELFQSITKIIETLPKEIFSAWIYVSNWNAFIYFAASNAAFRWVD